MSLKLNFHPGPSQIHPKIPLWIEKGIQKNFFSEYHRKPFFSDIYKQIVEHFYHKLLLPKSWEVYFLPSATDCWYITLKDLVFSKAWLYYNGNFGKKWYEMALFEYSFAKSVDFGLTEMPELIERMEAFIGVVHTETSNGTCLPDVFFQELRQKNPNSCIVVDATSSMGGVKLPWEYADVWFASVQKCFGLPPGLAVMCCSPNAIKRALKNDWKHPNSINNLNKNFKKFQTPYTPNLMNIWLLNQWLTEMPDILTVQKILETRKKHFFEQNFPLKKLSYTMDAVTVWAFELPDTCDIFQEAEKSQMVLGTGYGDWKNNSFRIANFPAIPNHAWEALISFFKQIL